jgi:hypothetical protein
MDKVGLEIAKEVPVARIRSRNSKTLRSSFSPSWRDVAHRNDFNVIQFRQSRKMLAGNSAATYNNAR